MGFFGNIIGKIKAKFITAGRPASNTGNNIPPSTTDERTTGGEDEWLYSGNWVMVGSTNVSQIRYLHDEQILEVQFLNGRYYQYYNVPVEVADKFYSSDSPGRAQWNILRAGNYDYGQLTAIQGPGTKQPQVIRSLTPAERRRHNI